MRRAFSPVLDAAKVAALITREVALIERARRIVGLRRKERGIIEGELAEIHRLLAQLGYRRSA